MSSSARTAAYFEALLMKVQARAFRAIFEKETTMPSDTMTTNEPIVDAVPEPTLFDRIKADLLAFEKEALAKAHQAAVEALEAEHALLTDAEAVIARVRAKL